MAQVSLETTLVGPLEVEGISLNTGIGLGHAVLHPSSGIRTGLNTKNCTEELVQAELNNLQAAFTTFDAEIQGLISHQVKSKTNKGKISQESQSESRDILNTHAMMARDKGWKRQIIQKVRGGSTALSAVDQTLESIREKLSSKGNQTLWQERVSDFEDLSCRLKRHVSHSSTLSDNVETDYPFVVVADRIGPAELLDYNRGNLAGLVIVEQSQTSHVAIVARSLKIPVVGGLKDAMKAVKGGDLILVDGDEGRVHIRPAPSLTQHFDELTLKRKKNIQEPSLETNAPLSSQTLDGVSISLLLNAGLVEDVDYIKASGAEGVGLYRTEIPFMMRPKFPDVIEQTKLYREILDRAGHYPIVFRTLDLSGDKVLPYFERLSIGEQSQKRLTRSILDRPILLRYQLRAMIRACGEGELKIMLPMIAEVDEVIAAREVLDGEMFREHKRGNPVPIKTQLGAMIEIPSLVYQLPQLLPHVDFLSVGSNDLFQFFYAIDREYPKLMERYDVLSPTFLSIMKSIQDQCCSANVPLSVCGEMAGRPLEAMALIGLGYQTLSMSAAAVPIVKRMIRSLTYQEIADYMAEACDPDKRSIRQGLQHFVKDHGIYSD